MQPHVVRRVAGEARARWAGAPGRLSALPGRFVRAAAGRLRGLARGARDLLVGTVSVCMQYRVTGLAAEGGFFALLSLPPLVLGLVACLGYLGRWIGLDDVAAVRSEIVALTEPVLTSDVVASVVLPTFDAVTTTGRADVTLVAFAFSVWSGSRALNVYVDTISIMYGLGGVRGIVRNRLLSLGLYVLCLLLGVVVLPLVLIGPRLLGGWLPSQVDFLIALYWPVVVVLTVAGLGTLYHIATPVRSRWRRDLPGAVVALLLWVATSTLLRGVIAASIGGSSVYGPLASPIVVLFWLYVLAIAVLVGAAFNSTLDRLWPDEERARAREEARGSATQQRLWRP
ncbi:YihY/virulence factor BrkB family protein [Kineococcus xinjiangensis]|uniref:YihY/virulence factor BrkB family protein n=1 Tax=Kineococcus xinjiangensis TaxID=512762 RepID=UPI001FE58C7E|nr:YihY/virulence factor BrkB family protein [Kineococcus xinjiangensis]